MLGGTRLFSLKAWGGPVKGSHTLGSASWLLPAKGLAGLWDPSVPQVFYPPHRGSSAL